MNPHILNTSPDGSIVYVVNAGVHDREPNAHGETPDEMESASEEMEKKEADHEASSQTEHGGSSATMIGSLGNSLWAYEASNAEVVAKIQVGAGPKHPIPSPDGRWVYVTNTDDDSVSVISTVSWAVEHTITDLPEPHDGELTPDGRYLYLATSGDNTLTVVDTNTRMVTKRINVGVKPRGVVAGGENGRIAFLTNKGDGTLSIIDVQKETISTWPVGEGAHALRLSPDGSAIYIALSKEDSVAIVDASTGEVGDQIQVGKLPEQLDLSRDGKWLFASNNGDNTVSLINTETLEVVATVPVGQGAYGIQAVTAYRGDDGSALLSLAKNELGYASISSSQLKAEMGNKKFTLINVHIPYGGEIAQTDANIPYNQIGNSLNQLPDKDQPIVLYCRSGSMSRSASSTLVDLGFTSVVELKGGFNAWRQAGYDLIRTN